MTILLEIASGHSNTAKFWIRHQYLNKIDILLENVCLAGKPRKLNYLVF